MCDRRDGADGAEDATVMEEAARDFAKAQAGLPGS